MANNLINVANLCWSWLTGILIAQFVLKECFTHPVKTGFLFLAICLAAGIYDNLSGSAVTTVKIIIFVPLLAVLSVIFCDAIIQQNADLLSDFWFGLAFPMNDLVDLFSGAQKAVAVLVYVVVWAVGYIIIVHPATQENGSKL